MSSTLLADTLARPIAATRRILVGTDGPPSSAAAVTMARSLAEASGASVEMIAVCALIVERRANGTRANSAPPVVARAVGKDVEEVIQQLLPTAQCNPAIGAAMLRYEPVVG